MEREIGAKNGGFEGFFTNEKSYERSLMRMKPKIENEWDVMSAKTREVPKSRIQGEWRFNGYYPKKCKQKPLCHMGRVRFDIAEGTKNPSERALFTTSGTKTGAGCSLKELKSRTFGYTLAENSFLQFTKHKMTDSVQ